MPIRVDQTITGHINEKQLRANLGAQAPRFDAEDVVLESSGDGAWTVWATFPVDTREEADGRMADLLHASGAPPTGTSSGATDVTLPPPIMGGYFDRMSQALRGSRRR